MAWQTAAIFLELLATNRNLQTHQQLADAWSISAFTRFGAGKGFIFSEADLEVALESLTRQRVARK
jgi:hypothetical protein